MQTVVIFYYVLILSALLRRWNVDGHDILVRLYNSKNTIGWCSN